MWLSYLEVEVMVMELGQKETAVHEWVIELEVTKLDIWQEVCDVTTSNYIILKI